ncbi:MAG: NADH:flavin oxidoreductase, partial [Bacteroidales bacterium]|nr:NADH:flavin oxidoreductase [Bacteroidales bacterium]
MKSRLFDSYKLGPIELRNRTIRSAAFENMCFGNKPSQMLFDYHTAVARGGVGMTTIAYCAVDRSGVSFDGQLYVHDEIKDDLRKLTDAIHKEGAKVSIQLGHCGNMTHRATCKCKPLGPSNGFNLYSPTFYRKISKEEIHNIVKRFGEAV